MRENKPPTLGMSYINYAKIRGDKMQVSKKDIHNLVATVVIILGLAWGSWLVITAEYNPLAFPIFFFFLCLFVVKYGADNDI